MAVTTGKVRGHGQGITAAQVNLDPTTGCQSRYARTVTFKVMPLNLSKSKYVQVDGMTNVVPAASLGEGKLASPHSTETNLLFTTSYSTPQLPSVPLETVGIRNASSSCRYSFSPHCDPYIWRPGNRHYPFNRHLSRSFQSCIHLPSWELTYPIPRHC